MGPPSSTDGNSLKRWGAVSASLHAAVLGIGALFVLARSIPEPVEQGIAVELVSPGPPQMAQADVPRPLPTPPTPDAPTTPPAPMPPAPTPPRNAPPEPTPPPPPPPPAPAATPSPPSPTLAQPAPPPPPSPALAQPTPPAPAPPSPITPRPTPAPVAAPPAPTLAQITPPPPALAPSPAPVPAPAPAPAPNAAPVPAPRVTQPLPAPPMPTPPLPQQAATPPRPDPLPPMPTPPQPQQAAAQSRQDPLPLPPSPVPPPPEPSQQAGTGQTPPVARPQERSTSVQNTLERLRTAQQQDRPPTARPNPSGAPQQGGGSPAGSAALTQGEIRGLAEQIAECWNVDRGMLGLDQIIVELRVVLDSQGNVRNVLPATVIPSDPRARSVYESARRALMSPQCNPLRVPPNKYQTVMAAVFRFNPRGLVR